MNFQLTEREMLIITRKQKGIKQKDIAKELGVSQSAVSHHEVDFIKFSQKNYEKYKDFIINYDEKVKDSESQSEKVTS